MKRSLIPGPLGIGLLVLLAVGSPILVLGQKGPFDDSPVKSTGKTGQTGTIDSTTQATEVQQSPNFDPNAPAKELPKPPAPIPLDSPVGKEISMASPNAKTWFDAAMDKAQNWNFPDGVVNKYGEKITKEDFLKALIWIESNGIHRSPHGKVTKSWVGALGFGQLMPTTAKSMKVKPEDPGSNLKGMSMYIGDILDAKNVAGADGLERLLKAACAYNMGPYSSLLKKTWDQLKTKASRETVGYGIKLKMCLGFELTAWEKETASRLLDAPLKKMGEVADDFYARTHGLMVK